MAGSEGDGERGGGRQGEKETKMKKKMTVTGVMEMVNKMLGERNTGSTGKKYKSELPIKRQM